MLDFDCAFDWRITYFTGVHVERIDGQIVRGQIERFEHLFQRERLPVTHDHRL